MEAMVARILNAFDNASAADLLDGERWYERAMFAADALAAGTHLTATQTAGIIAALSPRVRWETNIAAAAAIVNAACKHLGKPIVAGFSRNSDKAWAIANGEPVADVLGGPKVTSFFANITGDDNAVTVDVWAARAAEGYNNPKAPAGKRYAEIAEAYRLAARARDVSPRVMQACVWVHTRRTFGQAFDQIAIDWKIA